MAAHVMSEPLLWMAESIIVHNWFLVGLKTIIAVSLFSCNKIHSFSKRGLVVWKANSLQTHVADFYTYMYIHVLTTSNCTCAIIILVIWYPMNISTCTCTHMNWSTCCWWLILIKVPVLMLLSLWYLLSLIQCGQGSWLLLHSISMMW